MNTVNYITPSDGDIYLVNNQTYVNSGGTDFDKIYNNITVDDSLENIFAGAAKEFGINENFLKAVAQAESGFDPDAVSYCGAQGIMQLMPYTAESYGVTDPFDARQNVYAGAQMLSELLDSYDGNATLALAAYNAGRGSVQKYGGVPPYEETLNYISKINDILGGALANDSTTVDGAYATDFTAASDVNAPDTITGNYASKHTATERTGSSYKEQDNSSLISYEEYLYVCETYKDILAKLFSAISADKGDNLAAELYNIVTGTGSERIGVTGTDIINNSSDEQQYIKTGTYYGQIEANVQLINRMPYDNVYKNDPQSVYQAQASMISPLVIKLLEQ